MKDAATLAALMPLRAAGEVLDQLHGFLFGDVTIFELLLQIGEEVLG